MRISLFFATMLFFLNTPTQSTIATSKAHSIKEGYLLVRYKPNVGISTLQAKRIHAKARAIVVKTFKYPSGLQLVKLKAGVSISEARSIYQKDPSILYAEPNYVLRTAFIPDDTYFEQQWGLHNEGKAGALADVDINAVEAWDIERGNKQVVIAIVDTGIDYTHQELAGNIWFNTGEISGNGIDDDNNGYIDDVHGINSIAKTGDPMDDSEHGTHIAGIIAGRGNNTLGISGVMQNASLLACKFLDFNGEGDTDTAIACLEYLVDLATRKENPINIVACNNSWSGGPFSRALYDAVKEIRDAGILFIAAASNDRSNNDAIPTFPANFDLSNVISVAAIDDKDGLAVFSNYGRYSVHVAAPGVKILSTFPQNRYGILSGTSMAAPFVTGLAGLIKSAQPVLTWAQVRNLIIAGGQRTALLHGKLISERRIRAWDVTGEGSLSCQEQKVSSRLTPKNANTTMRLGQSLPITMFSISCEQPKHTSTISIFSKDAARISALTLVDSGTKGDAVANDGVFTGYFVPHKTGTFQIQFSKSDMLTVRVHR
jgi:subtilisin family serine protease